MNFNRKGIVLIALFFTICAQLGCVKKSEEPEDKTIDREYVLNSKMIGYTGIGGDIDGVRNPVLRAKKGEIVKITVINGELMAHDIVMEKLGLRSDPIVEEGDTTSIVFEALEDDVYFCSIPGHRQMMNGRLEIVDSFEQAVQDEGYSPRKNGRPLNLGFERASLQDWTATGKAFSVKSVAFDPAPWYPDSMELKQSGDYYVTSGGTNHYAETGTLTSETFEITAPWASFKVAGGALQGVRVELVLAGQDTAFFQISGPVNVGHVFSKRQATFRPVVVNLEPHMGKEMFIRLVDEETGKTPEIHYIGDNRWAHISFDDFRFHNERPKYTRELRPSDIIIMPERDVVKNAGLSGTDAAREMTLPEGFSITLAASEPDITKPIAMAMDDRGRLWVVESHTYPVRAEEGKGEDEILIFEDTDGDGTLDSRKLFMGGLNLVSAIEVGFGGVWVGAAPYLMFIPIDESGDAPAGEPQILLDGFGYQDTHETLNTFTWGPDGWLYGTQGVFTHSKIGKPGTPDEERIGLNAGVFRYHPTRHEFEIFAHGTSNPWGIAFNDYGHPFITVCVIPHLYHVIQGARYRRQAGKHFNPYTYADINTIADHVHWMGDAGPHAGNFRSAAAGGGHAHAGAMFYLGNKHWGLDRNSIFLNNLHGHRVNQDKLSRKGSGYTASHGEDFVLTNDSWSLWLNFEISPSGSVFVHDWYDQNQCHNPNPDVHNKTLGRLYKITHEKDEWVQVDLAQKSDMELVELQLHENDWYVRHARRLLQERQPGKEVHDALWDILNDNPDITRKLRALWALHVTGGISDQQFMTLLDHGDEYVRSWAIQLMLEDREISDEALAKLEKMAASDESALVRLYLASAAQRIETSKTWTLIKNLSVRGEDFEDHNLPLMVWYALEPLVALDGQRAIDIAKEAALPDILTYSLQRLAAEDNSEAVNLLNKTRQELQSRKNLREDQAAAIPVIDQLLSAKK